MTKSLQIAIKDNLSNKPGSKTIDSEMYIVCFYIFTVYTKSTKCTLYVSIYLLCIQKVRNSTVEIKIETVVRVHHTLWVHR